MKLRVGGVAFVAEEGGRSLRHLRHLLAESDAGVRVASSSADDEL